MRTPTSFIEEEATEKLDHPPEDQRSHPHSDPDDQGQRDQEWTSRESDHGHSSHQGAADRFQVSPNRGWAVGARTGHCVIFPLSGV